MSENPQIHEKTAYVLDDLRGTTITEQLVRKKAEHNELEIFSLEELSLHQENIERIEHLDKWCRELQILYLQSNLIPKIENVGRLKKLKYLNLALNNVEKIENLEGCESLEKLDLTVNFVGELTSLESLKGHYHFNELYLTGNPCAQYEGYRDYVIATLPNLQMLDGIKVEKSERIKATQNYGVIRARIIQQQLEYKKKRDKEKEEARQEDEAEEEKKRKEKKPGYDNTWYTDINQEDLEKRKERKLKELEEEYEKDKEFFEETAAFTPESRVKAHKKQEEIKNRDKVKEEIKNPPKPPRRLFAEDGRPLNVNESKYLAYPSLFVEDVFTDDSLGSKEIDFKLTEDETENSYILDYQCYKYLETSLIDVDVQPTYVRIVIKGKTFQLCLDEEVNADSSSCQRSQITGHLLVTMPKTCIRMYSLRNLYQKVEILTNNSIRDAVVGQDLNFLKSAEGSFSHDAGLMARQIVKPKAVPTPNNKENKENIETTSDKTSGKKSKTEKLEVDEKAKKTVDISNIVKDKSEVIVPPLGSRPIRPREERPNSDNFVDDPDVPPLE